MPRGAVTVGPAGTGEGRKIICGSCGVEVDHWKWFCDSCGSNVEPRIGFDLPGEEAPLEEETAGGNGAPAAGVKDVEGKSLHRRLRKSLLIRIAVTVLIVAVLVSVLLLLARVRRGAAGDASPRLPARVAGTRLSGHTA